MIDTHSHIYLEDFKEDKADVIERCKNVGVSHIVLPNIDTDSFGDLIDTYQIDNAFFSVLNGLHPTSVKENYQSELKTLFEQFDTYNFKGIGEIGIDLYWDSTYLEQQFKAFEYQIDYAIQKQLPIIIHARESFKEIFQVLKRFNPSKLRGVFHSFTGNKNEIDTINKLGDFYFGINGIVTFKNASLREQLPHIGLNRLLLETDAPYLAPVPFRGKRNESSYLYYICKHIAEQLSEDFQKVDEMTTQNAKNVFNI